MVQYFPAQLSDLVFLRYAVATVGHVGLWTSIVGLPRVEGGEVALMLRPVGMIPKVGAEGSHGPGVPQVLLQEFSEGDLKSSSEGNRLTLVKSEGRVEWTGEGTSERFDFRASRAVSTP
ncbi:unnamed protein product [Prunus armeniaca]